MKCRCLAAALFFSGFFEISHAEDVNRIAALIGSKNLVEVANQLQSDSSMQWPEIASQNIEKSSEKQRMAAVLSTKIIEAKSNAPQTVVPAFCHIAAKLNAAGGYSNFVIADTAQRLAVASLIKALVTGDLSPEKVEVLAGSLSSTFPTTNAWIRVLNQEMSLGEKASILNNTKPENYLNELYALTGNNDVDAIYVKIGKNLATSTKLLQQRDIATLARRMAETETYRVAHLRALIFFIKNGGKPLDIDLNDVRDVNQILSKAPDGFGSPLLRMPKINALHLKMLAEDVVSTGKTQRILLGYE